MNKVSLYHCLRCWSSYEYPDITEDKIQSYFKGGLTYGLYEDWNVFTDAEFEEYLKDPPNNDRLIRVLEIQEL
jgi:hypothetical protein